MDRTGMETTGHKSRKWGAKIRQTVRNTAEQKDQTLPTFTQMQKFKSVFHPAFCEHAGETLPVTAALGLTKQSGRQEARSPGIQLFPIDTTLVICSGLCDLLYIWLSRISSRFQHPSSLWTFPLYPTPPHSSSLGYTIRRNVQTFVSWLLTLISLTFWAYAHFWGEKVFRISEVRNYSRPSMSNLSPLPYRANFKIIGKSHPELRMCVSGRIFMKHEWVPGLSPSICNSKKWSK